MLKGFIILIIKLPQNVLNAGYNRNSKGTEFARGTGEKSYLQAQYFPLLFYLCGGHLAPEKFLIFRLLTYLLALQFYFPAYF